MVTGNIFSGLKVVDFSTFVAAPAAAVILSDFGADVVKVEPPSGDIFRQAHQFAPMPSAKDPYPFHLTNRQARDGARPEVAERSAGSREARQVGGRVHRQYAT